MTKEYLIEETPEKVMSWLGVALSSLFLLFMVTLTNASFSGMERPIADPFSPAKIMATVDRVSNSYSEFLNAYLFQPAAQDVAFYRDNIHWVIDNSDMQILSAVGLQSLARVDDESLSAPRVAGAYTSFYEGGKSLSVDVLYKLLMR